ncbi:hypothetical protein BYT27DRAFT_6354753 [Phlegmacium glaucopus]|nr:hypothetical protein BYT27DRAFT_6354753 [Phlegmacium glaucopus]
MGLGSRARLENPTATGEETQSIGLSTNSAFFSSSLAIEKTLKDPATIPKIDATSDTQTKDQKKKRRKVKDEEMAQKDGGACEDKDERKERKRKRKLDKGKKDPVQPQDSDNDLKELKMQEKKQRKAKKVQVLVTSPHTDTPVDDACVEKPQTEKKGSKSSRDDSEHTRVHVS